MALLFVRSAPLKFMRKYYRQMFSKLVNFITNRIVRFVCPPSQVFRSRAPLPPPIPRVLSVVVFFFNNAGAPGNPNG